MIDPQAHRQVGRRLFLLYILLRRKLFLQLPKMPYSTPSTVSFLTITRYSNLRSATKRFEILPVLPAFSMSNKNKSLQMT